MYVLERHRKSSAGRPMSSIDAAARDDVEDARASRPTMPAADAAKEPPPSMLLALLLMLHF